METVNDYGHGPYQQWVTVLALRTKRNRSTPNETGFVTVTPALDYYCAFTGGGVTNRMRTPESKQKMPR